IAKIQSLGCPLVEITGGEPLLQKEAPKLISCLLDLGYRVLLETNGSRDISMVDARCARIADVKCPSSGEEGKNDFKNLDRLTSGDELKFVIGTMQDYDFA
ncbi:MAG: 7-carboxy-7-deazaguanine synthase, partial [Pseudomonadota bacterium]